MTGDRVMWRGTEPGSEGREAMCEVTRLRGGVGHCISVMSECPDGRQATDLVTCRILRGRRGGVAGEIEGQVTKVVQSGL